MKAQDKRALAKRRRWRVRSRISGTVERPRLSVHFSNRHIYAQCIDDGEAVTLVAASSLGGEGEPVHANRTGAAVLGESIARKALAHGIARVILDRGPRRYHGCVQEFADAARKAGLEF
ncbi:MAG: 50S ribosomal protein L18 [Puniceicoccales bacterium]|jgi:large subunit ribosomal protein L18|nr:50S ribosomal protein L18 [Puniceicoccales bacterium]